jgi:uncharacterized protein YhaN
MSTWMRRRSAIVEQAASLREMRLELAARHDAEAVLAAQLNEALAPYGIGPQSSAADLLAVAESVLSAASESAERRRTAAALRESQAVEISRIGANLSEARDRLSAWRLEWEAALQAAGLERTASPATAEAYLNSVRDITAGLSKAKDLSDRIGKMQADTDAFAWVWQDWWSVSARR